MPDGRKFLLIISRDTLLSAVQGDPGGSLLRMLATLGRSGTRVILTAPEPDRWVPTRRNVDQALIDQQRLTGDVRAAGGELDGVYYVARSLLTQDRNRLGALEDLLRRYGIPASEALLVSASAPFLKAAGSLGIATRAVAGPGKGGVAEVLATLLNA